MLLPCDICQAPAAVYLDHARCLPCVRKHGLPDEVRLKRLQQEAIKHPISAREIHRRFQLGHSAREIARAAELTVDQVSEIVINESIMQDLIRQIEEKKSA